MKHTDQPSIDQRLRQLAQQYETADFLQADPSYFMHQVTGDANREVMAFIAASLSYGSRKQFFPKIQRILDWSGGEVSQWVKQGLYERNIPDNDQCYYRLYTNHTMRQFLATLQTLLQHHGTLRNFLIHDEHPNQQAPHLDALTAIRKITAYFATTPATSRNANTQAIPHDATTSRNTGSQVIPRDATSACKRLCMFLRWMVRDSSPVDLGLWSDIIDKRTLIIPLDTHVLHQSLAMGLLTTKTANMATAQRLTARLRQTFPDDPLRADFALFGLGTSPTP